MVRLSHASNRIRLTCEELECRTVPASVYQWGLAGTTNNWDDASNWQVQNQNTWAAAAAAPTDADTVYFNGTSGRDVDVNVTSLGDVRITAAYTGTLRLPNNAAITAKLLTMGGGTIKTFKLYAPSYGTITLPNASNTMTGGTLEDTRISISGTAATAPGGNP